ncbi:hypothetical protein GOODEAATRI_003436, partial [Goodea atripinnis]
SGQVSVLSQALGSASHSHKLEFMVRSAEELHTVVEELKACHGQGRLCVLEHPVTVATAVQKMKSHLGLVNLRLALGAGRTLGEMSHHEVLDAVAKGTSVILSDHSNSERGFLAVFRERLTVRLPDAVTVALSKADRDPLEVV